MKICNEGERNRHPSVIADEYMAAAEDQLKIGGDEAKAFTYAQLALAAATMCQAWDENYAKRTEAIRDVASAISNLEINR